MEAASAQDIGHNHSWQTRPRRLSNHRELTPAAGCASRTHSEPNYPVQRLYPSKLLQPVLNSIRLFNLLPEFCAFLKRFVFSQLQV